MALKRTGCVVWQNKWKQCYRECSKRLTGAWSHTPSRFRHWSMASSTTLCCSPAHVSTSRCWKMTFLTFPRYSSYSMRVRWENLQPSNVKFLQDSVCQKRLKSVHFWRSNSKNKNVIVFLGHSVNWMVMHWIITQYDNREYYVCLLYLWSSCSIYLFHLSLLWLRYV